jgi:hypothetical protein
MPNTFLADLETLRWDAYDLAERLGLRSDRAARRWISGQNTPPAEVAAWVRTMAELTLRHPPPPPPPQQ